MNIIFHILNSLFPFDGKNSSKPKGLPVSIFRQARCRACLSKTLNKESMRRELQIFSILLIIFLLFPLSGIAQNNGSALAMISDVNGNVLLFQAQSDDSRKAVFGMQLAEGDRLETGRKANVTLLFSNGNLINLGPNSNITISGNQSGSSSMNIGAGMAGNFSDLAMRQDNKGEMGVLMDLRSDETSQQIIPLSPCNTMISTSTPGLKWDSRKPADEFVVRLYNGQGLVWEKRTTSTSMAFPEDEPALNYGESYFWNVEGEDLITSFRSLNQKFTILHEEKIREIKEEEKKLLGMFTDDPANSSLHSLLGAYYAKAGLFEDAINAFERVRDSNPDATLPHEILGGLYSDVGKKDLAIAELQKALMLEKEK